MNIKQLAQELDISTTTVSRVLSGKSSKFRISEKTSQKVRKAAKHFNFAPNQIAQNLRLQKTNTIGLIIPDISNPFFANLARSVETELRKRNMMVLLCDTKGNLITEEETIELLLGRKVDGLLVAPVGTSSKLLESIKEIPLVLIDRYFQLSDIPYVVSDNFIGAYHGTEYLIEKGHKYIACIQGIVGTSANENRIKGFKESLKEKGIELLPNYIVGDDYSFENGYHATKKLLNLPVSPTAIFALNNQISMGAIKALNEAGITIPDDISLLSFDEQDYFELMSPPLSAIKQPMQEIGEKAVETLFNIMDNNEIQSLKLKPSLIERASVKPLQND